MKKESKKRSIFLKVVESRIGTAVFYVLIATLVAAFVGLLLSLALSGSLAKFGSFFVSSFWFYGGAMIVAAILLIFTKIPVGLTFKFGCGLYYGTLGISFALDKMASIEESVRYIIGFVIASLVCYIVWIKKGKKTEDK